ncbi:hypothetical protein Cgig2_022604 [Carnegiea gigantea]|uniref:Uncharacterized protein n=1 Tax=Carnegiea gigantea TaxID=171969 RepID=A0A9Q1GVD5_9CARY|nr:hypothetical protein Cgig2_022604 [Carnegiea gigantea]
MTKSLPQYVSFRARPVFFPSSLWRKPSTIVGRDLHGLGVKLGSCGDLVHQQNPQASFFFSSSLFGAISKYFQTRAEPETAFSFNFPSSAALYCDIFALSELTGSTCHRGAQSADSVHCRDHTSLHAVLQLASYQDEFEPLKAQASQVGTEVDDDELFLQAVGGKYKN